MRTGLIIFATVATLTTGAVSAPAMAGGQYYGDGYGHDRGHDRHWDRHDRRDHRDWRRDHRRYEREREWRYRHHRGGYGNYHGW